MKLLKKLALEKLINLKKKTLYYLKPWVMEPKKKVKDILKD